MSLGFHDKHTHWNCLEQSTSPRYIEEKTFLRVGIFSLSGSILIIRNYLMRLFLLEIKISSSALQPITSLADPCGASVY
jgi:hypothetical protein